MKVELLNHTPLSIADKAIGKCWDKQKECVDTDRMYRVANKNKHSSTIEHINYSFDIDGISRACLQELARHRMASMSVKSTRYTLKELKTDKRDVLDLIKTYCVTKKLDMLDVKAVGNSLLALQDTLRRGTPNDIAKYLLPEAYKTSLVWTINARSLQNFLELRTSKAALWEIRDLANAIYKELPKEHKFLFIDFIQG